MEQSLNYTPLNTEKLTPKKKLFKISNKVLIGLILFFTVGVGAVGFLLTQETFQTQVPAQIDTTSTITPSISPTEAIPSATVSISPDVSLSPSLEPVTTLPETSPTEALSVSPTQPDPQGLVSTSPEPTLTDTPISTPTSSAIGGANLDDPTATPTEIILAQTTTEPTQAEESESTESEPTKSVEVPEAGVSTFSMIFGAVAVSVIFLGLIF